MVDKTFFCIDAHTCGNPVRVVAGGGPQLPHAPMQERRQVFLEKHDWIRKGLMFEPRGHDLMSGSMLYPPYDAENDVAILFIETSGCLPMCGHGTIGTVTVMIEKQLVQPKVEGILRLETPAGLVLAEYEKKDGRVEWVKLTNVASFLDKENIKVDVPGLGEIVADVAYGGNFYAIVDPQKNFPGLDKFSAHDILRFSPIVRKLINKAATFQHPEQEHVHGLSHVMWTGPTIHENATARNAVFYGEKAIDRSPCGTGTSARMAQWSAKGLLKKGDLFIHESIIGSQFVGTIEDETTVAGKDAIVPGIKGWAKITGLNTININDEDDPYATGFTV